MRDKVGVVSGVLATFTLGEVNLLIGCCAGLVTIICLLPNGVKNWREMACNYAKFKSGIHPDNRFIFFRYVFGLHVRPKQSAENQSNNPFGNGI